jgi:predicted MPP superfamily phosphohydrolase
MFDVDPYFDGIVLASTLVDLAVALAALLVRRPVEWTTGPRVTLPRLVAAVAFTSIFFAAKAVALVWLGVHPFGIMRLVYVDLVIVVPLIGMVLIWSDRAWDWPFGPFMPWSVRNLALASLLLPLVGYYATCVEPFRLRVEHATVTAAPGREFSSPLRIGVLSDLQVRHVGPYEHRVIDTLMAERPDLILMPGDVFQGSDADFERQRPALRALLAKLDAPAGVFLVPGDVDQSPGRLARAVEGTHITLLENAAHFDADRGLVLGGIELAYKGRAARAFVERFGRERSPGAPEDRALRILVAHRPDVVLYHPWADIDLIVAGHTHGGQVVVPGFGPIVTLSEVPRDVAAGGLHRVNGKALYVSRGAGCEQGQAPRLRAFCPPEVSILEVREAVEIKPGDGILLEF